MQKPFQRHFNAIVIPFAAIQQPGFVRKIEIGSCIQHTERGWLAFNSCIVNILGIQFCFKTQLPGKINIVSKYRVQALYEVKVSLVRTVCPALFLDSYYIYFQRLGLAVKSCAK